MIGTTRPTCSRAAAVALATAVLAATPVRAQQPSSLTLDAKGYFAAPGVNVLVYSNRYSGLFSDSKLSGIEIIQHDVRTATNGDVRLSNTPEQWDPVPEFVEQKVEGSRISTSLRYAEPAFAYRLDVEPRGAGFAVSVHLDAPLPRALEGVAGFNLEFLPSAYFEKTYLMDGRGGIFPQHPAGPMERAVTGRWEAAALASGHTLVLAPEDPVRRVVIENATGTLTLHDGRNKAQNGWYVVRGLLPAGRTGKVLEWVVTPNRVPGWTRTPVIAHSQLGYHPRQPKIATLETARGGARPATMSLLRVEADGRTTEALRGPLRPWGEWLRYDYARFDFTSVTAPGLYVLEAGDVRSAPFRIAADVFAGSVWQSSLDTFLPVQMDHVLVNDNYRVWHGASHLDDAIQPPAGHEHFDLYAMGPTTDSPFQPGEHIPHLDRGGWFDAGDFDLRTQSQYAVVNTLVIARETFGIDWDQTTVDEASRWVDLHHPDGKPDILQQIEHGVLNLLGQYRSVGHAIAGIIVPRLDQYTHLGDALTMTDNLVFDATLDSLQVSGNRSGTRDDRMAFTTKSTPLDYGAIAALAAASRVLRGYDDALADECIATARRVWDEEQARGPIVFRHGNTTGGRLEDEELKATVELLITSKGEQKYADRLRAMWPHIRTQFTGAATLAVRAMPYMDAQWRSDVEAAVRTYRTQMDAAMARSPFGVPISMGGWGGSGAVLDFAMRNDILHRAFPQIIGPEYTLRAFDYILGAHPASSVSLVSGIGTHSKTIAYGNNRADYSFIPGGIVPGIVVVQPDFPELKEDWPFLWYEGEYVIPEAAAFIYVGNAIAKLFQ